MTCGGESATRSMQHHVPDRFARSGEYRRPNVIRRFLVPFLFRAFVLSALIGVLAATDAGWGSGFAFALGAWLLLMAGTRFRFGPVGTVQARRLVALGDAMFVASSLVFAQSSSPWGWTLFLAGCASWYLAVRTGRRDELIEVSSAEKRSPREQTIVAHEVNQMPSHSLHRKRAQLRNANIVLWAGGIALLLLGLPLGLPWYSFLILLAVVLASYVYIFRDSLRALFDAWTRS